MMTLRRLFPLLLLAAIVPIAPSAAQQDGSAYKIAEYAVGDPDLQKAMLDEWTLWLKQDPTFNGYVIGYAGRQGEAQKAAAEAIGYAVMTHGVDPARLSILYGGRRESAFVELWAATDKAFLPPATPTKN